MKITGTGTDETGAQYDIVITQHAQPPSPVETSTTLDASTTTNPGNLTLTARVRPVPLGGAQPVGAIDWQIDGEYIVTADLLDDGTATNVIMPLPGQHVYGATFVPADPTRWAPSSAQVIYAPPVVPPERPWIGATQVIIGGASFPYSGTNVPRGQGQLVGFDTDNPNPTTGANHWGAEVRVLRGTVVGSVVSGQSGMAIQPDLILSGHEYPAHNAAQFLRDHAVLGASVTFRH